MKKYKTVDVPATKREMLTAMICDLCGAEIKDTHYDVDDVEITHRTGVQYPEGGGGKEVSVDMCSKCFNEKLIPWLKKQGCDPESNDWDY